MSGVAAMRRGIGQWTNEFHELIERPWPPVRDDERQWAWSFAALMDEVDALSVDSIPEMFPAVDRTFLGAPIVLGAPILDEFFEVGQIRAIIPASVRHFARPAYAVESFS